MVFYWLSFQKRRQLKPVERKIEKNEAEMACNIQGTGSPDAKKPCKGILKTSSSFDKHSHSGLRKSTKFDELNVLQTYHPPDKDYGHMKIDEPKTPYNYADIDENSVDQLDANLLAEKLRMAVARSTSTESDDSPDEFETEEQRQHRIEFEKRRKLHYNEFEAVKLARKLIEEDDEEDVDDTGKKQPKTKTNSNKKATNNKNDQHQQMDVEDPTAKQSTSSENV